VKSYAGRRLDWDRLHPFGPRGWLWRTPGFTAAEVARLLHADMSDERARAVRRCVGRPGDWHPLAPDVARCPTRYHQRLARIVFWYVRGESSRAIARRLGGNESPWQVEQVLDDACGRMAACLNRAPADYGLDLGWG
jgi:hypothetical protein